MRSRPTWESSSCVSHGWLPERCCFWALSSSPAASSWGWGGRRGVVPPTPSGPVRAAREADMYPPGGTGASSATSSRPSIRGVPSGRSGRASRGAFASGWSGTGRRARGRVREPGAGLHDCSRRAVEGSFLGDVRRRDFYGSEGETASGDSRHGRALGCASLSATPREQQLPALRRRGRQPPSARRPPVAAAGRVRAAR